MSATTTNCQIILLSLTSLPSFLDILAKSAAQPLLAARVARWIIPPAVLSVDSLTHTEWDLVLCYRLPFSLPDECRPFIRQSWSTTFAAPAELVSSYTSTFTSLASNIPARTKHMDRVIDTSDEVTTSSSLSTESMHIPTELRDWMTAFSDTNNHPPVIMLNLITFRDVQKYNGYREALAGDVGRRHGLHPILFGQVTRCSSTTPTGDPEWDLVGLIYYPSVLHFADMLSDEEYQEIRRKYRDGSLVDNPIMCLYL